MNCDTIYETGSRTSMALVVDNKKPFYSSTETGVRLAIFGAHALSAIFMLIKAYNIFDDDGCSNAVFFTSRMVSHGDPYLAAVQPVVYPLQVRRRYAIESCENDTSWNKGWCHGKNLPMYFDYINDQNSFVLGSSWNLIFLVTVFEWITASYALLYFDPFDSWLSYESLWWGLHPIPVIATIWNLLLMILMWSNRNQLNIPPNNAFLYTMALIATIVLQNYLSINRSSKIDKESDSESMSSSSSNNIIDTVPPAQLQLRFDHFLRNRKKPAITKDYRLVGFQTTNADFHEPDFMPLIEKSHYGVVPRYLEYCVTAPMLLVGLFINSIPYDLTWKVQSVVIALFVCNALGIALHQAVLYIPSDPKADDNGRYSKSSNYFFLASWLSLAIGFYIFIWTLRDFLLSNQDETGMPDWVKSLIWLMLVLYAVFGLIASRYYLPKMLWGTEISDEAFKWFYFYFDICSLSVKLPVAWTIWIKGSVVLCNTMVTC